MMMTASTMAPMAMAMPPRDMMFELRPWAYMTTKEISTAMRQDDDGHERAAQVQQEREADQRHHDAFLDELFLERLDRALDERAAVIDDCVADIGRQALSWPASSFFFTSRITCRALAP